jgi:hypothetical protein
VQKLLIALALSLFVSACSLPAGRDIRAYNVCLARHAQETLVCEGPRQAYEVDASDIPARAHRQSSGRWLPTRGGLGRSWSCAQACPCPSRQNTTDNLALSGAGARTLTALYDFWSKVGLLPDPVARCGELGTRVEI